MINTASFIGVYRALLGEVIVTWDTVRASTESHPECPENDKINMLFLAPRIPFPPNKGDKIRSFNEIKYLAKNFNIFLCTTLDSPNEIKFTQELSPLCYKIYSLYFNRAIKLIINCFSNLPFSVAYFYDKKIQNDVDMILAEYNINIIFCYCSSMAEYIFNSKGYKKNKLINKIIIIDYVDLDSDKWLQYSKYTTFPMNFIFLLENKRLLKYEIEINNKFDASIFVSEREISVFKKLSNNIINVDIVTNGVDTVFFTPKQNITENKNPVLLFTGFMNYFANEDGVDWFTRSILPLIREEFHNVEFYIVGALPTKKVEKLKAFQGVHVTGYVEDIRQYYWKADVFVAPLRIARGLQNKVLEAMATGNAVVATSNAKNGIISNEDVDIIIADDPKFFAEKVIGLLKDKTRRDLLGQRAVENVRTNYSWEKNLGKLTRILSSTVHQKNKLPLNLKLEKGS